MVPHFSMSDNSSLKTIFLVSRNCSYFRINNTGGSSSCNSLLEVDDVDIMGAGGGGTGTSLILSFSCFGLGDTEAFLTLLLVLGFDNFGLWEIHLMGSTRG